ncbi:MAG: radical SAM protein [Chloroflexota bacterium]
MLDVIYRTSKSDLATVFIAKTPSGKYIEFVESVQPPHPRHKKWVVIVSTLSGCPVGCKFCDSGFFYDGKLNAEEIFAQIEYCAAQRFPDGVIISEKFKVQFARMGDPALNEATLDVLDQAPRRLPDSFLPSVSTIAPYGRDPFFERLLDIKDNHYRGAFQLQFSIHSTDEAVRDALLPVKKWSFERISEYGERFMKEGDKMITLNFALAQGNTVVPASLLDFFDPSIFLIKLTPVNPTYAAKNNNISSFDFSKDEFKRTRDAFRGAGYDVIESLGEMEENLIGSNCGQSFRKLLQAEPKEIGAYSYKLENI